MMMMTIVGDDGVVAIILNYGDSRSLSQSLLLTVNVTI